MSNAIICPRCNIRWERFENKSRYCDKCRKEYHKNYYEKIVKKKSIIDRIKERKKIEKIMEMIPKKLIINT